MGDFVLFGHQVQLTKARQDISDWLMQSRGLSLNRKQWDNRSMLAARNPNATETDIHELAQGVADAPIRRAHDMGGIAE